MLGRLYPWGPSRASSKCRALADDAHAFGGIDVDGDAALQQAMSQDWEAVDIVEELFDDTCSVSTRGVGSVATPVGSLMRPSPPVDDELDPFAEMMVCQA